MRAQRGATVLQGWFFPTKKNAPAREFYREHGFELAEGRDDAMLWKFDLTRNTILPPAWVSVLSPAVRYHKQLHVPLQGDRTIVNTPLAGKGRVRPAAFFLGLLLLCASTLMYEIALTRLLSVTCPGTTWPLFRFRWRCSA